STRLRQAHCRGQPDGDPPRPGRHRGIPGRFGRGRSKHCRGRGRRRRRTRMTGMLEALLNGVSLGFIYTLLALGFVVIYRSTQVVNFAHGSMMLFGIYVVAELLDRWGFGIALAAGCVAVVLLAIGVERLLIAPLLRGGASHDAALIMTL